MDIVSRLKIFLQENGISNSLFADNCGIPRPTLSQLLNGRNKKVSDELIAKIHAAYPALNVMWLMFGDGDMFVPNANSSQAAASAQLGENAIEFSAASNDLKNQNRQTTINFGANERNEMREPQRPATPVFQHASMADALQSMVRGAGASMSKNGATRAQGGTDSHVVSIMVLYSDGRFESFVPQG